MKIQFSQQISAKYSNMKFRENSSSGGSSWSMRVDRRTDRQIWRS